MSDDWTHQSVMHPLETLNFISRHISRHCVRTLAHTCTDMRVRGLRTLGWDLFIMRCDWCPLLACTRL